MHLDIVLVAMATLLGIIGYAPYFKDIFAGKTKPHAFTWFIWALLTAIAFFAQLDGNGGLGAWVTGFTALIAFVIFGLALKVGLKNIARVDWVFLAGALAALGLWAATDDPLSAVILITLIDAIAFVPTFRKSYHNPDEETTITYAFSAIKFAIAIPALETLSLTTVLYPLSLVITNALFVAMVVLRRPAHRQTTAPH